MLKEVKVKITGLIKMNKKNKGKWSYSYGWDPAEWYYPPYVSEKCHNGTVKAFETSYADRQLIFYGGGESRGYTPESVDVTITTIDPGLPMTNFGINLNGSDHKYIYLPVTDYRAPVYSIGTYFEILDGIIKNINKDPVKIGVMCLGGHGRTGTLLATFLGLLEPSIDDPIAYVREHYCKKAIESYDQIDYIERITGKKTSASPSKSAYSSKTSTKITTQVKCHDCNKQFTVKIPSYRIHSIFQCKECVKKHGKVVGAYIIQDFSGGTYE